MIRKIMTAIYRVLNGDLSPEDISLALDGKKSLSLAPAPPEPLVLWYVELPVKFEILNFAIRRITKYISSIIFSLEGRFHMTKEVFSELQTKGKI